MTSNQKNTEFQGSLIVQMHQKRWGRKGQKELLVGREFEPNVHVTSKVQMHTLINKVTKVKCLT